MYIELNDQAGACRTEFDMPFAGHDPIMIVNSPQWRTFISATANGQFNGPTANWRLSLATAPLAVSEAVLSGWSVTLPENG